MLINLGFKRFLVKMTLTNDPPTIVVLLEESDNENEDSQGASDVDIDDHLSERSNDREKVNKTLVIRGFGLYRS